MKGNELMHFHPGISKFVAVVVVVIIIIIIIIIVILLERRTKLFKCFFILMIWICCWSENAQLC